MLAAVLIVGIIGRELFNAFYVVQELVIVLSSLSCSALPRSLCKPWPLQLNS